MRRQNDGAKRPTLPDHVVEEHIEEVLQENAELEHRVRELEHANTLLHKRTLELESLIAEEPESREEVKVQRASSVRTGAVTKDDETQRRRLAKAGILWRHALQTTRLANSEEIRERLQHDLARAEEQVAQGHAQVARLEAELRVAQNTASAQLQELTTLKHAFTQMEQTLQSERQIAREEIQQLQDEVQVLRSSKMVYGVRQGRHRLVTCNLMSQLAIDDEDEEEEEEVEATAADEPAPGGSCPATSASARDEEPEAARSEEPELSGAAKDELEELRHECGRLREELASAAAREEALRQDADALRRDAEAALAREEEARASAATASAAALQRLAGLQRELVLARKTEQEWRQAASLPFWRRFGACCESRPSSALVEPADPAAPTASAALTDATDPGPTA